MAQNPPEDYVRELRVLGRGLTTDEMCTTTEIARRIAAILLLEPKLDATYEPVTKSRYEWNSHARPMGQRSVAT